MRIDATRRDFLKTSIAGAIGAAVGARAVWAATGPRTRPAPRRLQLVPAADIR